MKHTLKVTLILVLLFLAAQIVGLFVIDKYIDKPKTIETGITVYQDIPYFERPDIKPSVSYIYVIIAILIGTGLLLLLIKFKKNILWKFWFFISVTLVLFISLAAFVNRDSKIQLTIIGVLALILAVYKVLRPNLIIQNLTEVLMYGGLAAIFVPIFNLLSIFILLIIISFYDMYAVWHSKHMIKLAKFQAKSKVFAGLFVPYQMPKIKEVKKKIGKVRTAILGGGDIAFPLLFAGVVMKSFSFLQTLIIPFVVSVSLLILFLKSEKGKFYPAMPFLTIGCLVGFVIVYLLF